MQARLIIPIQLILALLVLEACKTTAHDEVPTASSVIAPVTSQSAFRAATRLDCLPNVSPAEISDNETPETDPEFAEPCVQSTGAAAAAADREVPDQGTFGDPDFSGCYCGPKGNECLMWRNGEKAADAWREGPCDEEACRLLSRQARKLCTLHYRLVGGH